MTFKEKLALAQELENVGRALLQARRDTPYSIIPDGDAILRDNLLRAYRDTWRAIDDILASISSSNWSEWWLGWQGQRE